MGRGDDARSVTLYNLVEVRATGRTGLYVGGVLSPPERGGDWMLVRFEDGTEQRYRPEALRKPKGLSRIFDTERYAFTRSAPEKWRRVLDEWSGENAVQQLMGTLSMYAERQLKPTCQADEEGLLGLVVQVWFGDGIYGRIDRYTRERLRLAWRLTFHDDLPPDEEVETYLLEVRPVMQAAREAYFRERDAQHERAQRERLTAAVETGSYGGAPVQPSLLALD